MRDVVVTITAGGYAKRTPTEAYWAQRRGGGEFVAGSRRLTMPSTTCLSPQPTTALFFTNLGRVYRTKAYQPGVSTRDARGPARREPTFVPNQTTIAGGDGAHDQTRTEPGARDEVRHGEEDASPATTTRTELAESSPSTRPDEVIGARLVSDDDDLMLVSRKGMSASFPADDATLRPMGRSTSGVIGMRFLGDDSLLAIDVVVEGANLPQ